MGRQWPTLDLKLGIQQAKAFGVPRGKSKWRFGSSQDQDLPAMPEEYARQGTPLRGRVGTPSPPAGIVGLCSIHP